MVGRTEPPLQTRAGMPGMQGCMALGYQLFGSPAATFTRENFIVAQVIMLPGRAAGERPA